MNINAANAANAADSGGMSAAHVVVRVCFSRTHSDFALLVFPTPTSSTLLWLLALAFLAS